MKNKIGLWPSVAIVVGSIIGSSIFMKPATMAAQLGDPILLLMAWMVAGFLSFIGASINAEIGAMLPYTGGQYIYFRKMYGDTFAFIYGWTSFAVINTASVAAIAYVFAMYFNFVIPLPEFFVAHAQSIVLHIPGLGTFFPLEHFSIKLLAILAVIILTMYNYFGIESGSRIQSWMTWIKAALLIGMVMMIFCFGKGDVNHWIYSDAAIENLDYSNVYFAFIAAMSGAFAAYDGWNNLGFVAGEIQSPTKVIPRALIIGLGICIALYMLTNMAYLYMLPIDQMADSSLVAADAIAPITGMVGGVMISILVAFSTLGATNGNILACARVTFSMAEHGHFPQSIGKLHPKYGSPARALWLHCIWTCIFILSGSFDMLTDLFVFATWIFYGFAAFGIFILRKKMRDTDRPYKAWAYPYMPILFIVFTVLYFFMTLYNDIDRYISGQARVINSLIAIVIMLSGLLILWWMKKYNGKADDQ